MATSSAAVPLGFAREEIFELCQSLPFDAISGQYNHLERGAAWLTRNGCTCHYHYGGKAHAPNPFPEWLSTLSGKVADLIGLGSYSFSAVNAIFYTDGRQSLFWHADGENIFKNAANSVTIVSLSIGSSRNFRIKKKLTSDPDDEYTIELHDGDILVMTGAMQDHYLHCVPTSGALSKRFNLTFRYISRHHRRCQATLDNVPCPFSGLFCPRS